MFITVYICQCKVTHWHRVEPDIGIAGLSKKRRQNRAMGMYYCTIFVYDFCNRL